MILDIGPEYRGGASRRSLAGAGTIVWNGPVGVFEFDQFGRGPRALREAIAESRAFSLAGGGETLAAIAKYGVAEGISYISTGGGAFLEFLEGKKLPAIEILEARANAASSPSHSAPSRFCGRIRVFISPEMRVSPRPASRR